MIKDTKLAAAFCRITTQRSRGPSKILAALDAAIALTLPPVVEPPPPSLLHSGTSHPPPLMQPPPVATAKPARRPPHTVLKTRDVNSYTRSRTKTTEMNAAPILPLYSYKDYYPAPAVVYVPLTGMNKAYTERRTAVVQLCDKRMILVIQLSQMKQLRIPQKVKEVIESRDIVKMVKHQEDGTDDGEKLYRDYGILASNLVELGAFAHRADATFARKYNSPSSRSRSGRALYGQDARQGRVRSSNWRPRHAANDAHCAWSYTIACLTCGRARTVLVLPYGSSIIPRSRPAGAGSSTARSTSASSSSIRCRTWRRRGLKRRVQVLSTPRYNLCTTRCPCRRLRYA
ncbi:uncharacterized protein B0H18DRAFT_1026286 [Fomitopsis serialis]|uniref:uncharacterized protein n=1 Tax=Fomitopsis serialis TaxID=139415 RepID=UPI0020076E20|nr:uncharacterized protein B0H18DRAFT_1026286 [Neoantrodia serialis]KAH9919940.1 hypothetical protein B0H18DRAFT_1026286 [Neoantrodia serialis]